MKICIDPRHSGPFEPGACAGGYTEAAINLKVSKKLRGILQRNGYDVFLSREDNVYNDGLTWRAEKTRETACFSSLRPYEY